MTGTADDDLDQATADVIRDRTEALIAQSMLLVGELRTRSRQLADLVADLAERAAAPGGDPDA